jgi:hypothetical protein
MFGGAHADGMKRLVDRALEHARNAVEDQAFSVVGTNAQRDAAKAMFANMHCLPFLTGLMLSAGGVHPVHKDGRRPAGAMQTFHVIFSLGLTCTYHAGSTKDEKFDFELRSGDVAIYDGITAWHGLKDVRRDNLPSDLPDWCKTVRMGVIVEVADMGPIQDIVGGFMGSIQEVGGAIQMQGSGINKRMMSHIQDIVSGIGHGCSAASIQMLNSREVIGGGTCSSRTGNMRHQIKKIAAGSDAGW